MKLTEGLMLMDNDPMTSIEDKVLAAARFYEDKHGMRPNICYIYQGLGVGEFNVNGVKVVPAGRLAHHLLIGRIDK